MKKNGGLGYFKGLVPHGIPAFVLPIMIIVEFIGLFTKPFALLMRLFANIVAGSIIILSLDRFDFYNELGGSGDSSAFHAVYIFSGVVCGIAAGIYFYDAFRHIY